MEKSLKIKNLMGAISPYEEYCEGYGNTGGSGNNYLLGVALGIGKTKTALSHEGSQMLDEINAFDIAETDGAYIGQLNMSTVSSFCGPQGLIWGYDIAKKEGIDSERNILFSLTEEAIRNEKGGIPVYGIQPLIDATIALLGTNEERRFPLKPGSHVPFASKNIKRSGPKRIYAGLAIGIARDREKDACLLMEDIGEIPLQSCISQSHINKYEELIINRLAKSILRVGENQKVDYSKIFVGVKSLGVDSGEIGCALVACPYFTIAQNAVPKNKKKQPDFSTILEYNTEEWLSHIVNDN